MKMENLAKKGLTLWRAKLCQPKMGQRPRSPADHASFLVHSVPV